MSLKPREFIAAFGPQALSDQQLLMLLLGNGSQGRSIDIISLDLLRLTEELRTLSTLSVADLCAINGVGLAKASLILGAVELGQRVNQRATLRKGQVISSYDLGNWLLKYFQGERQEHLLAVFLDTKNQIIDQKVIFTGTLNHSIVHPRELFHEAVQLSCFRFIMAHNHPSGIAEPSKNDLEFTKRMVACGKLMGIECLDHFVVGAETYTSLKESKFL